MYNCTTPYSPPNFNKERAVDAASFAEILIEVGRQTNEARQHCYNRDAELDNLRHEVRKQSEENRNLTIQLRLKTESSNETIESLKIERSTLQKQGNKLQDDIEVLIVKLAKARKQYAKLGKR